MKIHDLFRPQIPQENPSKKDALDHFAAYAESRHGSWDVFRVLNLFFSYLKLIPSASIQTQKFVEKAAHVKDTTGIGLSFPGIISDANALRRSLMHLTFLTKQPSTEPMRDRKIAHASKKSFIDGMNLTNTLSQAALFLNQSKVYEFSAASVRQLTNAYNGTSLITDSVEMIESGYQWRACSSAQAKTQSKSKVDALEEKKTLAMMTGAKDVVSVGGTLVAISGGMAPLGLALGTAWLTLKISCVFYEKLWIDARNESPLKKITT